MSKSDKKKKTFAVVLFEKEQKYSTVPATWVAKDKTFCWWPGPSTKNQSEIISDPLSQPQKGWKQHPVSYVKLFDSLTKADKRATELKNPLKHNLANTTDDDLGTPTSAEAGAAGERAGSDGGQNEEEANAAFCAESNRGEENIEFDQQVLIHPVQIVTAEEFQIHRDEINRFQAIVIEKLEGIANDLKDLKRQNRHYFAQTTEVPELQHKYPPLPLKNSVELAETEKYIQEKDQFDKLVAELKRVGGTTVNKNVYNILRHLMSHELSSSVRYTDKSGKISFGNLVLAKAVRSAVQALWGVREGSDSIVNNCIGNFFRNTNTRKDRSAHSNGDAEDHEGSEDKERSSSSDAADKELLEVN